MRRALESLEPRLALVGDVLEVPLIPLLDQFGGQIGSVQAYADASETRVTFAIYDTGASVVTFSAADQLLFELLEHPIPIKNPGGAQADAIGGVIVGDVSEPGDIIADGLHAITINEGTLEAHIDFQRAAHVPGVQAFVGTTDGSPLLPTITGTPIHNPSPSHPNGSAALIDMDAYAFNFGELFPEVPEFEGLIVYLPDLSIVAPNTPLVIPPDGTTGAVRIPLQMWGVDNHLAPGNDITASPNPVQTEVALFDNGLQSLDRTLLFDTGAMLSVISTEIAEELGLDLENPEHVINVQGAAGAVDVPGFTLDALELPRDDNGDGAADGLLRFTSAPVYVLDLVPGLDGILGMNLFNLADQMLFDPFDADGASLTLSFFVDLVRDLPTDEEQAAADMLASSFPAFAGLVGGGGLPGFQFDGGARWNNRFSPADIDASGAVINSDAMTIVGLLRDTDGGGALASLDLPLVELGLYPDVNADNYLSNIDAMIVVSEVRNSPGRAARSLPVLGAGLGSSTSQEAAPEAELETPTAVAQPFQAVGSASAGYDSGLASDWEVGSDGDDGLWSDWDSVESVVDHWLDRHPRLADAIGEVISDIRSSVCEIWDSHEEPHGATALGADFAEGWGRGLTRWLDEFCQGVE